MTVGGLLAKWNWKAAVLSAAIRGAMFFGSNLHVSLGAAGQAALVDVLFRLPLAGCYAAVIQSASTWERPRAAVLVAFVAVPSVALAIEGIVHFEAGTPALQASLVVSGAFSVLSSAFEWFAMRRRTLIVGAGAAPFASDLRRLPSLVGAFLMVVVSPMVAFIRRGHSPTR